MSTATANLIFAGDITFFAAVLSKAMDAALASLVQQAQQYGADALLSVGYSHSFVKDDRFHSSLVSVIVYGTPAKTRADGPADC